MKKNKKIILLIFLLFILFNIFSAPINVGAAGYTNQEKIPGSEPTGCLPEYIKQIISFGFAVIGILALCMLCIGAYQYLMAAGNIGKVENARETIASALLGLVLGLTAWLILEKINPDLVSMSLDCQISNNWTGGTGSGSSSSSSSSSSGTTPSPDAGKCVVGTGECAESKMGCFGSQARNASITCNAESGGVVKAGGDKCGGQNVSYGLMQMNTSCHNLGLGCENAFKRTDTGAKCCIGSRGCKNSNCQVADTGLYQQCIAKMQDPTSNLQAACQLQKASGWGPWSGAKKCGIY